MKKILLILAVAIIATSLPAVAAEHAQGHDERCLKECQMLVKNCGQEVDSLQQRIARLNREISRGSTVYSAEELRILERRLKETKDLLVNLTTGA